MTEEQENERRTWSRCALGRTLTGPRSVKDRPERTTERFTCNRSKEEVLPLSPLSFLLFCQGDLLTFSCNLTNRYYTSCAGRDPSTQRQCLSYLRPYDTDSRLPKKREWNRKKKIKKRKKKRNERE